jgi:hypothetical protein
MQILTASHCCPVGLLWFEKGAAAVAKARASAKKQMQKQPQVLRLLFSALQSRWMTVEVLDDRL